MQHALLDLPNTIRKMEDAVSKALGQNRVMDVPALWLPINMTYNMYDVDQNLEIEIDGNSYDLSFKYDQSEVLQELMLALWDEGFAVSPRMLPYGEDTGDDSSMSAALVVAISPELRARVLAELAEFKA